MLGFDAERHQALVGQWLLSGRCPWVRFGIPRGTALRAHWQPTNYIPLCRSSLGDWTRQVLACSLVNDERGSRLQFGSRIYPHARRSLCLSYLGRNCSEYKLPKVVQFSKRLKLSDFRAIAAAKQPTTSMSMHVVPESSKFLETYKLLFLLLWVVNRMCSRIVSHCNAMSRNLSSPLPANC